MCVTDINNILNNHLVMTNATAKSISRTRSILYRAQYLTVLSSAFV